MKNEDLEQGTTVALFLAVAVLVFFALMSAGCPKPIPPTPLPPSDGFVSCGLGVTVTQEGLCAEVFTADGHACVRCQGGSACLLSGVEVYCMAGTSCTGDSACKRNLSSQRPRD